MKNYILFESFTDHDILCYLFQDRKLSNITFLPTRTMMINGTKTPMASYKVLMDDEEALIMKIKFPNCGLKELPVL